MSWEIRVWHEDLEGRTRLCVEAGDDIPDEVIGTVAGSYWFEQVQYGGEEWDDEDVFGDDPEGPGGHLHG